MHNLYYINNNLICTFILSSKAYEGYLIKYLLLNTKKISFVHSAGFRLPLSQTSLLRMKVQNPTYCALIF